MAMQAHEIERLIKEAFPDALVQIEDLRGDGDHYGCLVETSAFEGKAVSNSIKWYIRRLVGVWAANYTP